KARAVPLTVCSPLSPAPLRAPALRRAQGAQAGEAVLRCFRFRPARGEGAECAGRDRVVIPQRRFHQVRAELSESTDKPPPPVRGRAGERGKGSCPPRLCQRTPNCSRLS